MVVLSIYLVFCDGAARSVTTEQSDEATEVSVRQTKEHGRNDTDF
jgi:hypothetical protein